MSALNLPKPVNSYAGEDELRNVNAGANGTANGGVNGNGNGEAPNGEPVEEEVVEEYRAPRRSDKFLAGIIYPPKEIRAIVDKTALHIFKSPTPDLLEEKIREHQKNDPKFTFLSADDPYYQYYKYMLEKSREDAEDAAKGIVKQKAADAEKKKKAEEITTTATEPRAHEFKVDLPGVTAHDLDILRLTALFHARRGRAFLSSLSVREGRNYQFDFLRPTHSLYGYYNRMVESYQKIMQPPPGQIDTLIKAANDPLGRWGILEDGRNRAEWEKYRRRKKDIKQKEKDDEAEADAVIDWQDFVLVETIEFTQSDMELNLPPPSSIEELRNRSMGEKRMASMIMEETGAGAPPTSASSGPSSAGMPGAPTGPRSQRSQQQQQQQQQPASQQAKVEDDEMEMEEDDEEEAEELRLQRIKEEKEQARAREIQRAAMESRGMKIKKDYVPKGINRNVAVNTAKCPNCGQSIPENELAEHIRIELLDPRWKEQKRQLEARKQQHYSVNPGADISSSLRNLAAARTDLFGDEMDEATRKAKEEDEKRKKREREKIVWDGHTATAAKTSENFQTSFNLEEQIKHMHQRMGLVENADGDGPKIGPAVPTGPRATMSMPDQAEVPPALAAGASTPGGGTAYEGATISAPPSGPTTKEYYESAPLRPAPGLPSRPAAASGAGMGIHPSRMAMMATGSGGDVVPASSSPAPPAGRSPLPPTATAQPTPPAAAAAAVAPITGQTRPAPDDGEQGGAAKRAKVEKLAFGQYTEVDWLSLHPHPITISIQLPAMPDKPEWRLDGSVIPLDGLMVNSTFGDMRERIKRALNVELPISRLQITYEGKVMANAATLASVNLGEGDLVGLGVKGVKKK